MKIQETRTCPGGFMAGHPQTRVIEVPDGTPLPEGAKSVPDETPAHDWRFEEVN